MDLPAGPIEGVFTSRDVDDDRALRRAHRQGAVFRVRRGAYVSTDVWRSSDPERRCFLRVAAVVASRGFCDVLSHQSAALLLGIETLRRDETVHVLDPRAQTTRTANGLIVHAGPQDPRSIDGPVPFHTTGFARTLADLALTLPFVDAVAAIDSGLHRLRTPERRAELRGAVEREVIGSGRVHGRNRALRALRFADGAAANPGESLSRVVIAQLGFAVPQLQTRFDDTDGLIGYTDFFWPEAKVVGEFDGFVKYSKPELLGRRSPSEVVVGEKGRERRLEALPEVRRVARWVWDDLTSPSRLFRELTAAGVPRPGPEAPTGEPVGLGRD